MRRSIVPAGFESTAHPVFNQFETPSRAASPPADVPPSSDSACPICLLRLTCPVTLVSCRHSFCSACLRRWFRIKLACPICKSEETDFLRDPEVVEGNKVWRVFRIRSGKRKRKWGAEEIRLAAEVHKQRARD